MSGSTRDQHGYSLKQSAEENSAPPFSLPLHSLTQGLECRFLHMRPPKSNLTCGCIPRAASPAFLSQTRAAACLPASAGAASLQIRFLESARLHEREMREDGIIRVFSNQADPVLVTARQNGSFFQLQLCSALREANACWHTSCSCNRASFSLSVCAWGGGSFRRFPGGFVSFGSGNLHL